MTTQNDRITRLEDWVHEHDMQNDDQHQKLRDRVSIIEKWIHEHLEHAELNFAKNREEHMVLMHRLDSLELSLLGYRRVVYAVGTLLGMFAGALWYMKDAIWHFIHHVLSGK